MNCPLIADIENLNRPRCKEAGSLLGLGSPSPPRPWLRRAAQDEGVELTPVKQYSAPNGTQRSQLAAGDQPPNRFRRQASVGRGVGDADKSRLKTSIRRTFGLLFSHR
jgi:hypothetical protein